MTKPKIPAPVKILDKMITLLEPPGAWCQHKLEHLGAHCVAGALNVADHGHHEYLFNHKASVSDMITFRSQGSKVLWDKLNSETADYAVRYAQDALIEFNNAPTTDQVKVVDLLKRIREDFLHPSTP